LNVSGMQSFAYRLDARIKGSNLISFIEGFCPNKNYDGESGRSKDGASDLVQEQLVDDVGACPTGTERTKGLHESFHGVKSQRRNPSVMI